MKFLCGNCKAKYQIADEKVTGRTLRMKCRRCGHDILIDGHTMPNSSPPSAAPAARRSSGSTVSVVPGPRAGSAAQPLPRSAGGGGAMPRPPAARSKPPSGLSAEFRRHVAAPPEVPQRTAPYDLWHVAIQDVPVGPMTRDELSRKIEAGAVTAESLGWREGMDDWRPIGELAELAQLLRRRAPSPQRGRPPPNVPGPGASGSRSAPLPLPQQQQEEVDEDNAEPTRISEFTPALAMSIQQASQQAQQYGHQSYGTPPAQNYGGQMGTSPKVVVQPMMASPSAPLPDVSTQVMAAPAQSRSSLDKWGLVAIGMLAGILVIAGPKLVAIFWSDGAPAQPAPAVQAPAPERTKTVEPPVVEITPDEPQQPEEKPEATQRPTARAPKPATSTAAAPKTEAPKPTTPTKQLSDEQRKLLERMGGGSSNEPDLSKVARSGEEGGGSAQGQTLTPQQLTKVVQDNKNGLQRCYETALRAAGGKQDGTIKIVVNVLIGGSGTTKSVSTQGDGLGNMTDCIRSSVKRWRFPQTGGEQEFAFPLVFQPGA